MTQKDKIYLNKTLYLLRKLPDKKRAKLSEFIFEERTYGPSYIANEMFEYLTGSPSCEMKSICLFNFNLLKRVSLPAYPQDVPYFEITSNLNTSKSFYKNLLNASKVIYKMPDKELKNYIRRISKPNTSVEILEQTVSKTIYFIREIARVKASHYVQMVTDKKYRAFYKQIKKEFQKVKE